MKLEPKKSRSLRWVLWLSPVVAFVVAAKLLNTDPPTNFAQTSPDHEENLLRSRFYHASWREVVSAAQRALHEQRTYGRGWAMGQNSISGATPGGSLTEVLRVHVPVFVFTDDFHVTLEEEKDGVRVNCHSSARLGKGDFGENRRHVLQYLETLDGKLADNRELV